jgi:hypothetical protein
MTVETPMLNQKDIQGLTPAMYIFQSKFFNRGNFENLMEKSVVRLNIKSDNKQNTCLHFAVMSLNFYIINYFLYYLNAPESELPEIFKKEGNSILSLLNIRNKNGQTPISLLQNLPKEYEIMVDYPWIPVDDERKYYRYIFKDNEILNIATRDKGGYYRVLGVSTDASIEKIKEKVNHKFAEFEKDEKNYDKNKDKIINAYAAFMDPVTRNHFDPEYIIPATPFPLPLNFERDIPAIKEPKSSSYLPNISSYLPSYFSSKPKSPTSGDDMV